MTDSILHARVDIKDVERSRQLYNWFPSEELQPDIAEADLTDAAEIIIFYGAEEDITLHAMHSHGRRLHPGEVMVTSRPSQASPDSPHPLLKKERLAAKEIDYDLYGRVYALTPNGEMRKTEMQCFAPRSSNFDCDALFRDMGKYLISRNLQNNLGLKVTEQGIEDDLMELETEYEETITFRKEDVEKVMGDVDWRVTNWEVLRTTDGLALKGNEGHASKKGSTTHTKFIDGKFVSF